MWVTVSTGKACAEAMGLLLCPVISACVVGTLPVWEIGMTAHAPPPPEPQLIEKYFPFVCVAQLRERAQQRSGESVVARVGDLCSDDVPK